MKNHFSKGFSAIELLVTLFVAAAFVVAGYQLYNVIVKDGGQARADAKAVNVAYDYMRRYLPVIGETCTPSTPLNNSPITVNNLNNVTITISITCPYASTSGNDDARAVSQITATVNYNNGKTQTYTTYATSAEYEGESG